MKNFNMSAKDHIFFVCFDNIDNWEQGIYNIKVKVKKEFIEELKRGRIILNEDPVLDRGVYPTTNEKYCIYTTEVNLENESIDLEYRHICIQRYMDLPVYARVCTAIHYNFYGAPPRCEYKQQDLSYLKIIDKNGKIIWEDGDSSLFAENKLKTDYQNGKYLYNIPKKFIPGEYKFYAQYTTNKLWYIPWKYYIEQEFKIDLDTLEMEGGSYSILKISFY